MQGNRHLRQKDLVDSSIFEMPVTVVGAGAIGSFVTLALAKIGFCDILVYDGDTIEEHNISNQFYPVNAIGQRKVDALQNMIKQFEGIDIAVVRDFWDKTIPIGGLVISAVDTMKVRNALFKSVSKSSDVFGFIDGRMGKNQLEVYTCKRSDAHDKKRYKGTLCKDHEAEEVRCTEKAVMYNVLTVSSWIVNQARLMLSGKDYNRQLILDMENMILVIPQEVKK